MTFWLLMLILLSATAVAASVPLIRRYDGAGSDTAKDVAVYDDQVKEVDSDLGAGAISEPEAKAAKTEINKRLDEARQQTNEPRPISPRWRMVALVACAGLIILGGVNLYGVLGSPEMPSATPQPAAAQQNSATADANANAKPVNNVETMINNLKARLQAEPGNAEGWRTLGWALFNTQKFQESADAYAKAVEIDPSNIDYKSAYAEALVQAAQGIVVPKAQGLIADVLAKDPKELRARFYDALAHEQAGDQQGALDRWQSLLADAPADAPWREDVKQRVVEMGKALGKDVSAAINAAPANAAGAQQTGQGGQDAAVASMISKLAAKLDANPKDRDGWAMMIRSLLVTGDRKGAEDALAKALEIFKDEPETVAGLKSVMAQGANGQQPQQADQAATAVAPKISADQQAAVEAMAPADQQAMIASMVQRLADKMKANPKDAEGWTRLMQAYVVLKQQDKAKAALGDAVAAFEGDADTQGKLKAAAAQLGIN